MTLNWAVQTAGYGPFTLGEQRLRRRLQEMQPWFHSAFVVLLVDGTELRLSRSRREHLQTRLQQTF